MPLREPSNPKGRLGQKSGAVPPSRDQDASVRTIEVWINRMPMIDVSDGSDSAAEPAYIGRKSVWGSEPRTLILGEARYPVNGGQALVTPFPEQGIYEAKVELADETMVNAMLNIKFCS